MPRKRIEIETFAREMLRGWDRESEGEQMIDEGVAMACDAESRAVAAGIDVQDVIDLARQFQEMRRPPQGQVPTPDNPTPRQ